MKLPWKYILVSFVIGLLLGAAGGLYQSRDLARHWIQTSPERYLKHLDHDLHLTDAQRSKIHSLLNERRDKLMVYEDELRQQARRDIRIQLSAEQQTAFDAMVVRHDAERQKREGR